MYYEFPSQIFEDIAPNETFEVNNTFGNKADKISTLADLSTLAFYKYPSNEGPARNQIEFTHTNTYACIKYENKTEANHNTGTFPPDDMEAAIKVENYNDEDDGLPLNIFKCELVEFDKIETTEKFNPNNTNEILLLETIPKIKPEIFSDKLQSSSNQIGDLYNIDTNSDSDSNCDPELDPFGDINCDLGFSQKPRQCHDVNDHSNSTRNRKLEKSDAKLQCQLCYETLSSESRLKTHIETCTASHKNRHRFCVPCNKLFSIPHSYRQHALNKHGIQEPKIYRYSLKCKFCPRSFAMEDTLVAHLAASHHKSNSTNGNISDSSNTLANKSLQHPPALEKLTSRLKSHTKERPIKCRMPNCNKAFCQGRGLRDHMLRVHTKGSHFMCPEPNCGKKFKTKSDLAQHHVLHAVQISYECAHDGCSKAFKNQEGLTKHLATHSVGIPTETITDRPFKCPVCDRAFCKKWLVTKHLKSHENKQRDLITCPEPNCGTTFICMRNLKCHISKIHTNKDVFQFQCPEPNCGKQFKYKDNLVNHLGRHTVERPFKCSQPHCSATYKTKNDLTYHVKSKHRKKVIKQGMQYK